MEEETVKSSKSRSECYPQFSLLIDKIELDEALLSISR